MMISISSCGSLGSYKFRESIEVSWLISRASKVISNHVIVIALLCVRLNGCDEPCPSQRWLTSVRTLKMNIH